MDAPAHWPRLELAVNVTSEPPPGVDVVGVDLAVIRLRSGGSVAIDRVEGRATFSLSAHPRAGALVHPHLGAAAAIAARWLGRETFHAGGFVVRGGVWGLLGDRGAGKSSTLAALALAGVPVVCDDILVLDGETVMAGPRSIDLRPDAAHRFGVGEALGVIGTRERWRVGLDPIASELPLRGWVALGWDHEQTVTELRGSRRLLELMPHRALLLEPTEPGVLIGLSALPFYVLRRPHGWNSLEDAIGRLLDVVGQ